MCENVSLPLQEEEFESVGEERENVESSEEHCEENEGLEVEGEGAEHAVCLEEGEEDCVKSKKSHHIQGLYKPPTHDELQTLKETQNLFKSNLMKLQVSQARTHEPNKRRVFLCCLQIAELLQEVKPKKKTVSSHQLEEFLRSLRETLLSLPSTPQVNVGAVNSMIQTCDVVK